MNRAIRGQVLFGDVAEYLAFQHLLAHALSEVPTRLLAYCLMPNHWHMLLWPAADSELTAFVRWLTATHARRLHRWRGTTGTGAVYQSRFRAVPVENEGYFYRVARYVERNAVRAQLAERADGWPWCSASPAGRLHGIELAEWPVERPPNWLRFVNDEEPVGDVDFIRAQTACGDPIGRVPPVDLAISTISSS